MSVATAIAFVERPFMGKSSAFIAFLNVDGGIMFKVFVGRDEAGRCGRTSSNVSTPWPARSARPVSRVKLPRPRRKMIMQQISHASVHSGCRNGCLRRVVAVGRRFAGADNALLPRNLSPWGMFANADIVVKAVMIGLAFASLVTWTVWLAKTIELGRGRARAKRRLACSRATPRCPTSNAIAATAATPSRRSSSPPRARQLSGGVFDDGFKERIALRLERVEAAMSRQIARGTGVLATIGATAPFVGLFGTVWGIMNAFIGISEAHTTNLAVVAPGIAEALLATALGLIAAIPAVVIYNHLARSIAAYRALLGDASAQVMLLICREGDRRGFRARAGRGVSDGRETGHRSAGSADARAAATTILPRPMRSTSRRSST